MTRVRVKICGITSARDLRQAVEAGADAVGFVLGFPASPRNLSLEDAAALITLVPVFVDAVAVVPITQPNFIQEVTKRCRPNILQLHGGVPTATPSPVTPRLRLIRSLSAKDPAAPAHAEAVSGHFDGVLLDSHVADSIGGTGTPHDWNLSARIRARIDPTPLILAGGLTVVNVGTAIRAVSPYAVDVSSGVERAPGKKDPTKVRAFIQRVQSARV